MAKTLCDNTGTIQTTSRRFEAGSSNRVGKTDYFDHL